MIVLKIILGYLIVSLICGILLSALVKYKSINFCGKEKNDEQNQIPN